METGAEVPVKKGLENVFEFNESSELSKELVWGKDKREVCGQLGLKKKLAINLFRGRKILEEIRETERESLKITTISFEETEEVEEVGDKPRFSVWVDENGQEYIEMNFERVGVSFYFKEGLEERVRRSGPVTHKLKGYELKHVLVKGQNDQVLDIMSTVPKDKQIETLMTLSENNRVPEGSERYNEEDGSGLLSMSFLRQGKGNEFYWDINEVGFIFLHETGHDLITTAGKRRDTIAGERDTNALAILRARDINRAVGSKFFDISKLREKIQNQLEEGYNNYLGKSRAASTKARKERREQKTKFPK